MLGGAPLAEMAEVAAGCRRPEDTGPACLPPETSDSPSCLSVETWECVYTLQAHTLCVSGDAERETVKMERNPQFCVSHFTESDRRSIST